MFQPVVLVVLATLLQGYLTLNRMDVITEYEPILKDKQTQIKSELLLATQEAKILFLQQTNTTLTAMDFMNTQIKRLWTTISAAKNASKNNPKALVCIENLQDSANGLDTKAINSTCGKFYSEVDGLLGICEILGRVPGDTVPSCDKLNPVGSQDDGFSDCLTGKIVDLDLQVEIFKRNFTEAKTETIRESVGCVADESAKIAEKISDIELEVALCQILE